jgi:hypothetical protein
MTILRGLCARPWWAAGVSPSDFKFKLLADHPTVLLDDWQSLFRGSDKNPMTGFLLSGCHRAPDVAYQQSHQQGGFSADDLQSFCPKAFAGLEPLPPSLTRRSIPIVLQRRKPQELVKSALHLLLPQNTRKFTAWMQTWAQDQERHHQISENFEKYDCQTQLLPGFSPHQQNCSRVLIALADTLGGHWPEKARTALQEIFREQYEREATPIHLLADIRDAFAHHGNPERLFTAELLDYLHNLDNRPWYEWSKNGDPLTAKNLSGILGNSFNIRPRGLRRGKTERLRGYQLCEFVEKWERYLPDPTSHQSQQNRGLSHCHSSNTEAIEDNAVADSVVADSVKATAAKINKVRSASKLPNYQLTQLPNPPSPNSPNSSIKSPLVTLSHFKAGCQKAWTKSTSRLKQFVGKAVSLFTTTSF